jgi:hypothetical protein
MITRPTGTVSSQAAKSTSEFWVEIIDSIKAPMLLRLTVAGVPIASEYLSYTGQHNQENYMKISKSTR